MTVIIAKDKVSEPLYAVVPVSNAWRWKSRVKHTQRAIKHFIDAGAVVILVEVAFNRRALVFEDSGIHNLPAQCEIHGREFKHQYIGLHSSSELWLKENIINVGVQHITELWPKWEQVCWLDSDVNFSRPNWVGECIHQLQHYSFLQMFSQARDLSPDYELLPDGYPHAAGVGFVSAWQEGTVNSTLTPEIVADLTKLGQDIEQIKTDFLKLESDIAPYGYMKDKRVFPGLAWAATRKAWDDVGGLLDIAIWGGGDWHLSHALVEKTDGMMLDELHPNYKQVCMELYNRCKRYVRRNVGVMSGVIHHNWHGKKINRQYNKKHLLLAKYALDPVAHLKRDAHGLWQLNDDGSETFIQIRDMMREIALSRKEDSIDV